MSEEERQEELRRARKFNRIALLGLLAVFVMGAALGIAERDIHSPLSSGWQSRRTGPRLWMTCWKTTAWWG